MPSLLPPQWLCGNSCAWAHDVHHVPKCMSYHKTIVVITRRAHCIYIIYIILYICIFNIYVYIYIIYIIYIYISFFIKRQIFYWQLTFWQLIQSDLVLNYGPVFSEVLCAVLQVSTQFTQLLKGLLAPAGIKPALFQNSALRLTGLQVDATTPGYFFMLVLFSPF